MNQVNSEKKDNVDELIEQALREDIELVEILEDDVEREWQNLKLKLEHKAPKRRFNFKKIAVIFIGIIINLSVLNTITDNEVWSLRAPLINTILNFFDKRVSLDRSIITDENNIIQSKDNLHIIVNSLEEAKDIMSFNFKVLPYDLDRISINILGEDYQRLELNYILNGKNILFIQSNSGQERRENINAISDSSVSEFLLNDVKYTIIKAGNNYTNIIWNLFGIKYSLDIEGILLDEEIVAIIMAIE